MVSNNYTAADHHSVEESHTSRMAATTNNSSSNSHHHHQQLNFDETMKKTKSVSEFYNGKTLFITGGTGFMGKVLLEKLLRSCPNITNIYLLIRPKRGQDAHERLKLLMGSPLFDAVRKQRPQALQKVLPIEGDITQPELAISEKDREKLARTVHIVFHSAATVKFDEKLKLSVTINMLGTQRLIELCKRMTNLEALVHVSTAYCNCDRTDVKEEIYPPPMSPNQMTSLVDCLDEQMLDMLTKNLVGNRPNTYTFTKALAECWLKENKGTLPLVIVRPSIVISSADGPLKGWVDNWNGPTGIIAAAGKGLFRSMLCDPEKVADLVPVDMVINLMLVAAWDIGTKRHFTAKCDNCPVPIYNCSTGMTNPITWYNFVDICFKYSRRHPFSEVMWYPDGTVTSLRWLNITNQMLFHWLPACLIDGAVKLVGGKPMMMKVQDKLTKAATCLEYFTMNEWRFDDANVRKLNGSLSDADRLEFCFDVAQIDWDQYIENYILGIRRFIFKEDESTLVRSRQQMHRLFWYNRLMQLVSVLGLWYFVTLRCKPLRAVWMTALRLLLNFARMLPFV